MIVLICGFRDAEEPDYYLAYERRLRKLFDFLLKTRKPHTLIVIEGVQRGVDFMAGREAVRRGCGWVSVPANWTRYGKGAGPLRNEWMLQLRPDRVYGLHHDWKVSKGTVNCLERAQSLSIKNKRITVRI